MYVSDERPSIQAWKSVRRTVKGASWSLLRTTALAALAWWLPRWVLPTAVVAACAIWSLWTLRELLHSVREWRRIRRHVAQRQLERLVDDVHDL